MATAAAQALNNIYTNASDGSSNVALYKLLLKLANASAMGNYSGSRPVTTVAEYLESFGETQVTRQFRADHSAIIVQEAKLA